MIMQKKNPEKADGESKNEHVEKWTILPCNDDAVMPLEEATKTTAPVMPPTPEIKAVNAQKMSYTDDDMDVSEHNADKEMELAAGNQSSLQQLANEEQFDMGLEKEEKEITNSSLGLV